MISPSDQTAREHRRTGLAIAAELALPLEAVTQTFGILAVRGAGKSNTAAVMAEEMFDAGLPFVVIDPVGSWFGLRSSSDGKHAGLPIPIFGGKHGDVPLERTSGELLADLVVDKRLSCVVDLSGFDSEAAKKAFLLAFAQRLFRRNEQPLHLFLEEADDYIPQRPMRDEAQLLRAWENIVRRGRARGLGLTLITQRSASLNKSVLTQVETLFAMRTTGPQDQAAIAEWVKYHAQSKALLESLSGLEAGEAWCWSPGWLKVMKRVHVRRRRTFDSGATPKHAAGGSRPVATLADVDLPALQAEWGKTKAKAEAEDPKRLQKRIAELERELQGKPAIAPPVPAKVERVEVPIFTKEERAAIEQLRLAMVQAGEKLETACAAARAVASAANRLETRPARQSLIVKSVPTLASRVLPDRPPRQTNGASTDPGLKLGARRMLEVLVRMQPQRLTREQLGTLAFVQSSGGTFSDYLSALRRDELVDESGADLAPSARGLQRHAELGLKTDALGQAEVLAHYLPTLKAGARRMLEVLVEDGDWHTRAELGAGAGIDHTGGTFSDYLSMLKRNGLAQVEGGRVRVSPTLSMGGS